MWHSKTTNKKNYLQEEKNRKTDLIEENTAVDVRGQKRHLKEREKEAIQCSVGRKGKGKKLEQPVNHTNF